MADINNQPNIPQKARGDEALGRPSQDKVKRGKGTQKEFVDQHEIKHEKDVLLSERPSIRARALVDNAKGGKAMPKEAMKLYAEACDKNLDGYERYRRARRLAKFSGQESKAADILIDIAKDSSVDGLDRISAAKSLSKFSGQKNTAANILIDIAKDKNADFYDRRTAAETLATFFGQKNNAVKAYLYIIQDENVDIANRLQATESFLKLPEQDQEKDQVADTLLSLVKNKSLSTEHQLQTAELLIQFPKQEKHKTEAAPILLDIAKDNKIEIDFRERAANALSYIPEQEDKAALAYLSIIQDGSVDIDNRLDAVTSLLQLPEQEKQKDVAAATLLKIIQSDETDTHTRLQAAESLIQFSKQEENQNQAALKLLSIIQNDKDDINDRLQTAETLLKFPKQNEVKIQVANKLSEIADNKTTPKAEVIRAAKYLTHIPGKEEKAKEILLPLAQHKGLNALLRINAIKALSKILAKDELIELYTKVADEKLLSFFGDDEKTFQYKIAEEIATELLKIDELFTHPLGKRIIDDHIKRDSNLPYYNPYFVHREIILKKRDEAITLDNIKHTEWGELRTANAFNFESIEATDADIAVTMKDLEDLLDHTIGEIRKSLPVTRNAQLSLVKDFDITLNNAKKKFFTYHNKEVIKPLMDLDITKKPPDITALKLRKLIVHLKNIDPNEKGTMFKDLSKKTEEFWTLFINMVTCGSGKAAGIRLAYDSKIGSQQTALEQKPSIVGSSEGQAVANQKRDELLTPYLTNPLLQLREEILQGNVSDFLCKMTNKPTVNSIVEKPHQCDHIRNVVGRELGLTKPDAPAVFDPYGGWTAEVRDKPKQEIATAFAQAFADHVEEYIDKHLDFQQIVNDLNQQIANDKEKGDILGILLGGLGGFDNAEEKKLMNVEYNDDFIPTKTELTPAGVKQLVMTTLFTEKAQEQA